jgi:hypothetical protein
MGAIIAAERPPLVDVRPRNPRGRVQSGTTSISTESVTPKHSLTSAIGYQHQIIVVREARAYRAQSSSVSPKRGWLSIISGGNYGWAWALCRSRYLPPLEDRWLRGRGPLRTVIQGIQGCRGVFRCACGICATISSFFAKATMRNGFSVPLSRGDNT